MKILEILPVNRSVHDLYQNHGHFHQGDSGLDLFCIVDETILPGEISFVDLGIRCGLKSLNPNPIDWIKNKSVWKYHSYFVMPRSSLAKTPLIMKNSIGLIDANYTGSIKIPLMNISTEPYRIHKGDRLVQLIRSDLNPIHFQLVNTIRQTTRGSGGFGST
jgi:dUTP pyrophosphatase